MKNNSNGTYVGGSLLVRNTNFDFYHSAILHVAQSDPRSDTWENRCRPRNVAHCDTVLLIADTFLDPAIDIEDRQMMVAFDVIRARMLSKLSELNEGASKLTKEPRTPKPDPLPF
jgi:hypothetical protein